MGKEEEEPTLEELIEQLNNSDWKIRKQTIPEIGNLDTEESSNILHEQFMKEKDRVVKKSILLSLAKREDRKSLELIYLSQANDDVLVRETAKKIMQEIEENLDGTVLEALDTRLGDKLELEREKLSYRIKKKKLEEMAKLCDILDGSSSFSLIKLEAISIAEPIPFLIENLKSNEQSIRKLSVEILHKLLYKTIIDLSTLRELGDKLGLDVDHVLFNDEGEKKIDEDKISKQIIDLIRSGKNPLYDNLTMSSAEFLIKNLTSNNEEAILSAAEAFICMARNRQLEPNLLWQEGGSRGIHLFLKLDSYQIIELQFEDLILELEYRENKEVFDLLTVLFSDDYFRDIHTYLVEGIMLHFGETKDKRGIELIKGLLYDKILWSDAIRVLLEYNDLDLIDSILKVFESIFDNRFDVYSESIAVVAHYYMDIYKIDKEKAERFLMRQIKRFSEEGGENSDLHLFFELLHENQFAQDSDLGRKIEEIKETIYKLKEEDMIRWAEEKKKESEEIKRRYELEQLVLQKDHLALNELYKYLKSDNSEEKMYGLWGLGKLQFTETIDEILPLLEDQDKYVRRRVIELLGKLDDKRTIVPLKEALEKEIDNPTKDRILELLSKLKRS